MPVDLRVFMHERAPRRERVCVHSPGWERNSTNSPVVSAGSLPDLADLEQEALKR